MAEENSGPSDAAIVSLPIKWFVLNDINGFFGLMFDNITDLSFMAGILIFAFHFPPDIVFTKMFPGTALGVFFGDMIYSWMAIRLARRTHNPHITAIPLGLDTPSTISMALAVLGPAFIALKAGGMTEHDAAMMTWYIGMASTVMLGVLKIILSFVGFWIQKRVPQAGLLGSLAGIGLALIGFIPILDIFRMPLVGIIALGLILYTAVARIKFPGNLSGVLVTVVICTSLYYILGHLGILGFPLTQIQTYFNVSVPVPSFDFFKGLVRALDYLPLTIPFGILTIMVGINVTASARFTGDVYVTRNVLLTEAFATLLAGLLGGVAQTTPYVVHSAYKKMGCRVGYTFSTGLFIGLGGILGYLSFIVELIPRAVIAPLLFFVGLDLMRQAYHACPDRHSIAVSFAFLPTVARMMQMKLTDPDLISIANLTALVAEKGKGLPEMLVIMALGNGFILTAMLWGAFLAELIDRNLRKASLYLWILALLTFFGIIHSAYPNGNLYFPWNLPALDRLVPYKFSAGYAVLGGIIFALSYTKESKKPLREKRIERRKKSKIKMIKRKDNQ